MKKFLFFSLFAVLFTAANAQDNYPESGVRVPEGYQGHIEYSNLFYYKGGTSMEISTTHGFFYTNNMYVGLGIGFHVAPSNVYVPVFAAAKYVFVPSAKTSPTLQLRMGSFFTEGAKPYCDVSFGLRFASDRDFAFSIQACASYFAPFDNDNSYWDYTTDKYISQTTRTNLSCVGIRLGIEW
ncbi:MAG: hypothetical protein ACSW76_01020 [Bacteroidaceae bacterium]